MFYIAISKSISLFEISMAAINIRHKLARVLVILRRRRKRRQKAKAKTKRKFWISPLNVERSLRGHIAVRFYWVGKMIVLHFSSISVCLRNGSII